MLLLKTLIISKEQMPSFYGNVNIFFFFWVEQKYNIKYYK